MATDVRTHRVLAGSLRLIALVALLLSSALPAPAAADWVVTVDGSRIETDGAWTEKGRMIVFTTADGKLMSMRASEIDVEASRRLTSEMSAPRPVESSGAENTPKPSVFRLTDADVGHVDDDEYFGAPDVGDDDSDEGEQTAPILEVTAWDRSDAPSGDGVEVRATLANRSTDVAVSIAVDVTIFDEEGERIANAPGQLASNGLAPGQTTDFVATFPGVIDFTSVHFDVSQRALRTRPLGEAPESGEPQDTDTD